jgi:hypothetical protein
MAAMLQNASLDIYCVKILYVADFKFSQIRHFRNFIFYKGALNFVFLVFGV